MRKILLIIIPLFLIIGCGNNLRNELIDSEIDSPNKWGEGQASGGWYNFHYVLNARYSNNAGLTFFLIKEKVASRNSPHQIQVSYKKDDASKIFKYLKKNIGGRSLLDTGAPIHVKLSNNNPAEHTEAYGWDSMPKYSAEEIKIPGFISYYLFVIIASITGIFSSSYSLAILIGLYWWAPILIIGLISFYFVLSEGNTKDDIDISDADVDEEKNETSTEEIQSVIDSDSKEKSGDTLSSFFIDFAEGFGIDTQQQPNEVHFSTIINQTRNFLFSSRIRRWLCSFFVTLLIFSIIESDTILPISLLAFIGYSFYLPIAWIKEKLSKKK